MRILSSLSGDENCTSQDFPTSFTGMMHTGNNISDTTLPPLHPNSYGSHLHGQVPVLPSQQHPSGQGSPDELRNILGPGERRRSKSNDSAGESSSSTCSASPGLQFPSSDPPDSLSSSSSRVVRMVAPTGNAASSSTTATAMKAKRKRSMIACKNCNERRVRCDGSITGLPCTTCKSAGRTDCAFIDSKRVRGKRGRFESRDKAKAQTETQSPITPPGSQSMALTRSPKGFTPSIPQGLSFFPKAGPHGFYPNMPYNSHLRSPMHGSIHLGGSRRQNAVAENHIWRRLFESQPGVPQTQRITYVGEAWHLSWVLHQKTGSSPLHFASPVEEDSPEPPPPTRRIASAADASIGISNPENGRIAQLVSEVMGGNGGNSQAAAAVQASIDAFVVPPAPIRDALIESYFSHFHPFFPILNKERFNTHLNSSMTNKSPSLLLLQSMLMIGAMHCPLSLLTSPLPNDSTWKPFSTRTSAIEALVHRARMLFNIDHEKDRLSVIQSMFLLQFWWRIPTDYKDQSYWMAGAIRIAQGMGLHRSTRENWAKGILDDQERMLWRKMWWALYIRDRQIAAAMGKPVLIHDEDCDVEELVMEDFPGETKETAMLMLQCVKLARVLHEILLCEFTPSRKAVDGGPLLPSDRALRRERCQKMLEDWQRELPPEFGGDLVVTNEQVNGGRGRLKRLIQLIFKIYFQSYELLLHRPIVFKPPGKPPGSASASPSNGTSQSGSSTGTENPAFANPPPSSRQLPVPIASHAAKLITQHTKEVFAICNGDVRYLPLNFVSFLFAALSVQLVELKSVDADKERVVREDIDFNLSFLGSLAEMYPIAGWCRKLLVKILNETAAAAPDPVPEPPQVNTQGKGPDHQPESLAQAGLQRTSEGPMSDMGHDVPSRLNPPTFDSNCQYPAPQHQGTDMHLPPVGTTYEGNHAMPESAYRNLHNAHPHYNPHHAYHNINYYQLSASPEGSPEGYSHGQSPVESQADIVQAPAPTTAFNPFDLSSLEAHNDRIRSMGIKYIDPSPSESSASSRVPTPIATTTTVTTTSDSRNANRVQEMERRRLSQKWAGDVLLDTDLLNRVSAGILESTSQHQRELDRLRYHVLQEDQQNMRLVEEVFDEDGIDNMEEEDVSRERILQAAAAAAGRHRGLIASGQHHNTQTDGPLVVTQSDTRVPNARPRLQHAHTHPVAAGAAPGYDNHPWVFDGAGALLGNPFLIGSGTDAYGNPINGTGATVSTDTQQIPVSQGTYHHNIPYSTQGQQHP